MSDKVIVGLSGGVDSAVSAFLLKQQGYQVIGLFMKNWEEDDAAGCPAEEDLASAEQVATTLNIPLHTANFSDQYWDNVFEHFLSEYRSGRTPNPDVLCNREIKFKAFLEHATSLGADKIAMGHYAGNELRDGYWRLLKGADSHKDQSYFLHRIEADSLATTLFPLTEYRKDPIRTIAKEQGFACHDRKDSTGICFISGYRFRDFLARYLPPRKGAITDENGKVIGEHNGCWYYTIGQRQGLGVGGVPSRAELPWYIARKDISSNTLTVVQGNDHPLLFSSHLDANDLYWIAEAPKNGETLGCKIRHRQEDQLCTVEYSGDNSLQASIQVTFSKPQRSIAPGQSAVFYRGTECLGGGIII